MPLIASPPKWHSLEVLKRLFRVDPPDPVAEEGPVNGKSTEGSNDEDREQRPYRCSVHAFDGSPPNRHSVEVLMLWGHKAPLCRPSYASGVRPDVLALWQWLGVRDIEAMTP
jgi:hypothetical protein